MKVKELYEFLKNGIEENRIDLSTEVILIGEYNYGDSLGKPYTTVMNLIDEDKVLKENQNVVAISTGAYLFECEDLGCSRMWIDNDDLRQLREEEVVE